MTREEMIVKAVQMRTNNLYGKEIEKELDAITSIQKKIKVPISEFEQVPVYQITPETRKLQSPMLINFHGGGFIKERQGKDQIFCSGLAEKFHALVWDVDYSLAPEYPFPQAVKEAYGVVKYAVGHSEELGIDPDRIVLLGHSAGGNLVSTVCMKAGETKEFKVACAIAEFFPVDMYTDPAEKKWVEGDMPATVAKTYNAFYCDRNEAKAPYVSPLFASEEVLKHFPDTLIISCGLDSLCYEDEEFALKLTRSGVTVTSKRFLNSRHGFTINRWDEWKESLALIEKFIKIHI